MTSGVEYCGRGSKKLVREKLFFALCFTDVHMGRQKHRGRNQRYSFQIDLDYCSSTLKFLQFWNQNVVNILFLVVK